MIRIIKSPALTEKQKRKLDGAPILDPDTLDRAIIGTMETPEGHAAVYDYEKLVKAMRRASPGSSTEDAEEWISYNTVRALPYMGTRAPWILEPFSEESVFNEDDVPLVEFAGRKWQRHL
jgi:hypothetical protein